MAYAQQWFGASSKYKLFVSFVGGQLGCIFFLCRVGCECVQQTNGVAPRKLCCIRFHTPETPVTNVHAAWQYVIVRRSH